MKIMKVLFRIGFNFLPSDIILFFFVDYQLFTVDQFKVLTGWSYLDALSLPAQVQKNYT